MEINGNVHQIVINGNVHINQPVGRIGLESLTDEQLRRVDDLISAWLAIHNSFESQFECSRERMWEHISGHRWKDYDDLELYLRERINWERNKAARHRWLIDKMAKYLHKEDVCTQQTAL